ncbi:ATP-binding protein [Vreelandella rituensis]|nr:ATP-binding protein [Halomonas rituensis]
MTTMTQPITLDVSRNGTIRTLADQFTSNTTFLKELLQNARRAGASKVEVNYVDGILTLIDDGHGITDPQVLFCIGKSEWQDMDMMATENPFGIGFAAALFAADRITVESNGWCIDAHTADILDFKPLMLKSGDVQSGSRITLALTDALREEHQPLHPDNAAELFMGLAQAFPIDILFNGDPLPAPLRQVAGGAILESGVLQGKLLATTESELAQPWSSNIVVVLQGFVLTRLKRDFLNQPLFAGDFMVRNARAERAVPAPECSSVLHLDNTKVRARVPDRDSLIDAEAVYADIRCQLAAFFADRLVQAKANLSAGRFLASYADLCLRWRMAHLLNDMPLLADWVETINHLAAFGEASEYISIEGNLAPTDEIFLANIRFDDPDPISAVSTYLAATNTKVIDGFSRLDQGHWAKANTIDVEARERPSSNADKFRVQARPVSSISPISPIEENGALRFDWFNMERSIVVCDAIELTPNDARLPSVQVTQAAVYDMATRRLLITRNATRMDISTMFLSMDSYGESDNGTERDETQLHVDVSLVEQVQMLHRGDSPATIIENHLKASISHLTKALGGSHFSVSISDAGEIKVA